MNPPTSVTPTRFRCKVGGEWKDRSQFSVTQQRNLQTARVDPAHSGMTCKQHSAGSRSELRCELCGLVKSIDDFSKSSRRKGEYASYHGAQCRRCVAWIEIQEPGLTPGPLETGHISPEEEQQQTLKHRFCTSEDFFPDDDDDLVPRAPITEFAGLGLDEESYKKIVGSSSLGEFFSRAGTSAASSVYGGVRGDDALPPHLRRKYKSISEAASSKSSTAGDLSLPTTLRESDSDAASIVNQFNAWGPDGEFQQRGADSVKADSALSSDAASAYTAPSNDPNVVGDWTRMRVRTKPAALPTRGKARWGKGSEISAAEMRELRGDAHTAYIRRDIDTQKLVRPIGYDDDSD